MMKKISFFLANLHRCAISREPVARSSLFRNSGQENSKNTKGGVLKFKEMAFCLTNSWRETHGLNVNQPNKTGVQVE